MNKNDNILSFGTYSTVLKGQKLVKESLETNESFESLNEDDLYELDLMAESSDFCTLDLVCLSEAGVESDDHYDSLYESSQGGWLAKSVNAQSAKIKPDVMKALKGLELKMSPTINKVVDSYIRGLKKALAKRPKSSEELFDIANQTPDHKYVVKVLANTYNKILKDNDTRAQSSLFSEDNKKSSGGLAIIQTAIKEAIFNIKEDGNKNGEKNIVPSSVTNPKPWSQSDIKEEI
jgi:phosphoribosyl-ATP pyrophosphohydrolase